MKLSISKFLFWMAVVWVLLQEHALHLPTDTIALNFIGAMLATIAWHLIFEKEGHE